MEYTGAKEGGYLDFNVIFHTSFRKRYMEINSLNMRYGVNCLSTAKKLNDEPFTRQKHDFLYVKLD